MMLGTAHAPEPPPDSGEPEPMRTDEDCCCWEYKTREGCESRTQKLPWYSKYTGLDPDKYYQELEGEGGGIIHSPKYATLAWDPVHAYGMSCEEKCQEEGWDYGFSGDCTKEKISEYKRVKYWELTGKWIK